MERGLAAFWVLQGGYHIESEIGGILGCLMSRLDCCAALCSSFEGCILYFVPANAIFAAGI